MGIRLDRIILTIAILHPFALLPIGDILFPNALTDFGTIPAFVLLAYAGFNTLFFIAWMVDGKQDAIWLIKYPFKEIKKFYTKKGGGIK